MPPSKRGETGGRGRLHGVSSLLWGLSALTHPDERRFFEEDFSKPPSLRGEPLRVYADEPSFRVE